MRLHHVTLALGISAALLASAAPVSGQGEMARPAAPAAKPWPPARTPDGQPDVQGTWRPVIPGTHSLNPAQSSGAEFEERVTGKGKRNPSRIVDPPDGTIPYQPWAAALQTEAGLRVRNGDQARAHRHGDPVSGARRAKLYYFPAFKIMQPAGSVVFVWDDHHAYRVIPLDGRPHVGPDVKLWMGDGRGRWEGNTLVVDTRNLKAKSRLDVVGDFFTDKAHLVERMTFVDANTMNYEATIDDPTVFTRPWTMRVVQRRLPDDEMWEWACHEGERDAARSFLGSPDTEKQ